MIIGVGDFFFYPEIMSMYVRLLGIQIGQYLYCLKIGFNHPKQRHSLHHRHLHEQRPVHHLPSLRPGYEQQPVHRLPNLRLGYGQRRFLLHGDDHPIPSEMGQSQRQRR